MYYDPMIAKLCTWAPTRGGAIAHMREALDRFEVEGIGHNLPFLSAVMDHPKFVSGDMTTAFIAEEYPDGFKGVTLPEADLRRIAVCCAAMHKNRFSTCYIMMQNLICIMIRFQIFQIKLLFKLQNFQDTKILMISFQSFNLIIIRMAKLNICITYS